MFQKAYYEKCGKEFLQSSNGKNILKIREKYADDLSSFASLDELEFIFGLLNHHKFSNGRGIENFLEVGTHRGIAATLFLKTGIQANENFQQICFEFATGDFFAKVLLDETSEEELKHCSFYKGVNWYNLEETLKDRPKLDLVFLDGGHVHPNPFLYLLSIIPFLHSESIVLLHDCVDYMRPNAWGESFIFTAWDSPTYRSYILDENNTPFKKTVLAAIEIPQEKEILYNNLKKIAKLPFRASPWGKDDSFTVFTNEASEKLKNFMLKYYDEDFAYEIYSIFQKNLDDYNEYSPLYFYETKFFNYLYTKNEELHSQVRLLMNENQSMIKILNLLIEQHKNFQEKSKKIDLLTKENQTLIKIVNMLTKEIEELKITIQK